MDVEAQDAGAPDAAEVTEEGRFANAIRVKTETPTNYGLHLPGHPKYSPKCDGTPNFWNDRKATENITHTWKKNSLKELAKDHPGYASKGDIPKEGQILAFLHSRMTHPLAIHHEGYKKNGMLWNLTDYGKINKPGMIELIFECSDYDPQYHVPDTGDWQTAYHGASLFSFAATAACDVSNFLAGFL